MTVYLLSIVLVQARRTLVCAENPDAGWKGRRGALAPWPAEDPVRPPGVPTHGEPRSESAISEGRVAPQVGLGRTVALLSVQTVPLIVQLP